MARVALLHAGGVEAETIAAIVEAAALPDGEVCLLIGDPELDADRQRVSVARELLPGGAQIFGLGAHRDREWDCRSGCDVS